jgi:hypothetical protein
VDSVIPEVQTIYLSVDGVERREVGVPLLRCAGEMYGILATEAIVCHETNRNLPHDR